MRTANMRRVDEASTGFEARLKAQILEEFPQNPQECDLLPAPLRLVTSAKSLPSLAKNIGPMSHQAAPVLAPRRRVPTPIWLHRLCDQNRSRLQAASRH